MYNFFVVRTNYLIGSAFLAVILGTFDASYSCLQSMWFVSRYYFDVAFLWKIFDLIAYLWVDDRYPPFFYGSAYVKSIVMLFLSNNFFISFILAN